MPNRRVMILAAAVVLVATGIGFAADEKVLYSFCAQSNCADGEGPASGLMFDTAGDLYGTTIYGGAYAGGVVFQLTRGADNTWTEKVLYSFCSAGSNCQDGLEPSGNLVQDAHGNLYGATSYGGYARGSQCRGSGCGTVFVLKREDNGTWTENVLHKFGVDQTDGMYPVGGLVFDHAGNLYGMTTAGGTSAEDFGTVFELSPEPRGKWTEKVLHSFGSAGDGALPAAGPTIDASGNLYGTTASGGTGCTDRNCGTVFQLTQSAYGNWSERIIHSFNGTDGAWPESPVFLDSTGNLYTAATQDGNVGCPYECGTVVEFTPDANGKWSEKVLRSFYQPRYPTGGIVLDAAGNLYSTTQAGGHYRDSNKTCSDIGCGTVFRLSPGTDNKWTESTVHSFGGAADGIIPISGLMFDVTGKLYGTTYSGGVTGGGTVFEIP